MEGTRFGRWLRQQRELRGLTLRAAAERIGTSPSRIGEIERGHSYTTDKPTWPSRELAQKIAVAFELPLALVMAEAGHPIGEIGDLDPESRKVVELFGALTPDGRDLAMDYLRLLVERQHKQPGNLKPTL